MSMSRCLLLAAVAVLAILAVATPVQSVSLSEFDSTVSAFEEFASLLETQSQLEAETDEHLEDEELAMLEVEEGENPSYTLPYPAVTYAAHAAGGFFHPYSNVNPLQAPWAGFAPVAAPVSVAAAAASPLSAYYAGALQPAVHAALGINTALYPAAFHNSAVNAKGGYNVHGLNAGNVFGGYHPGLAADLTSLGGKASSGGDESSLLESASEMDESAVAEAEAAIDADIESELDAAVESESEEALESEEEPALLEVASDDEKPEHPTYVLPYPPVLPGHYTPLFNPYTNVNPLSTPFANYAAQPGAHPGVASAAAAQAGSLAAVNGQIAGAAGGYPYYPYAARNPVIAAQLQGNPVPFSGYAGWIHPQNLNSAAVGENEEAASLGQFLEVATAETELTSCVGCSYD